MPKTVPCQVRSSGGRRSWSLMAALSRIANKVLQSTFPGLKIFFDFMASFSFTVQKFFVLSEIRIPLPVCCSFRNKKRADKSELEMHYATSRQVVNALRHVRLRTPCG